MTVPLQSANVVVSKRLVDMFGTFFSPQECYKVHVQIRELQAELTE